jgi:hypothetical protein
MESGASLKIKELIFGILASLAGLFTAWFFEKNFSRLIAGELTGIGLLIPIGILVLTGSLFSLTAVFVGDSRIRIPAAVMASGAPILAVAPSKPSLIFFGGAILLILFALHRIKAEFYFSFGFSTVKILKHGLPLYFTVVAAVLSFLSFTTVDEEGAWKILFPPALVQPVFSFFGDSLRQTLGIPVLRLDMTGRDLLKEIANQQLQPKNLTFTRLPLAEQTRLLEELRIQFLTNSGIDLGGAKSLADIFRETVERKADLLLGQYRRYLPAAAALTLFLALKTLTIPISYLTMFVTFLLIAVLRKSTFLKEEKVALEVEKLRL